jgi:hypothetical protein
MKEYIPIIFFIIYLLIQFVWTQKIYSKNLFKELLVLCLLTPLLTFIVAEKANRNEALIWTSIFFWYLMTLFVIKRVYKTCNTFLIDKKLLKTDYLNKDFTYANTSDDGDYWDEKLAKKPSWLDHILSISLFIIPIFIVMVLC